MSIYERDECNQIKSSINSILNQTYKPSQFVIVVDGPIPSKISEVLRLYENNHEIELYFLESNLGSGLARNFGITKSRNELIGVMDADDISMPERFEKQIDEMIKLNIDVLGGWIAEFDEDEKNIQRMRIRETPKEHASIKKYGQYRNPMNHVTLLFKKSFFQKIDGYRKISFYEDYDLVVRFLTAGYTLHNIQEVLVLVRCGNSMFTRRGGFLNVAAEINFFINIYKLRYISFLQLILNLGIRLPVRLVPSGIRKLFYLKFLRRNSYKK
jgi:glycosyltransferase involved in cell wall biosynthesis